MFTSRAENRLVLRFTNANKRLSLKAHNAKLINKKQHQILNKQSSEVSKLIKACDITVDKNTANRVLIKANETTIHQNTKLKEIIKRPKVKLISFVPKKIKEPAVQKPYIKETTLEADTEIKYKGYVNRINKQTEAVINNEKKKIETDLDYSKVTGLSSEAWEKLQTIKPENMGQAMRISGVSLSDLAVLSVYINKKARVSRET